MAVSITWSLADGGVAQSDIDHGSAANGANTDAIEIFLRHDGLNEITGAAFYLSTKAGTYSGDVDAASDFAELLGWGDAEAADDFGGFQINMNKVGSFDGGSTWDMDETQKTSSDGYKFTVRSGVGDSLANAYTLSQEMSSSMSSDGVIPEDVTDASFQCRVKVPTNEATAGTRQVTQYLTYTFTS